MFYRVIFISFRFYPHPHPFPTESQSHVRPPQHWSQLIGFIAHVSTNVLFLAQGEYVSIKTLFPLTTIPPIGPLQV